MKLNARSLSCLSMVVASLTGCVESRAVADPDEPRSTLRELVADERPLEIAAAAQAGIITAARRSGGAWVAGVVDLGIERGRLALRSGPTGELTLDELELALAPIALPEELIGQPAEFTQVRASLRAPVPVTATWFGTDAARVTAMVELDMTWALAIADASIPIFAPDLPPIPVVIDLDSDGHVIDAEVKLVASGELWSWAGLVRLEGLRLVLAATSAPGEVP